MADFPPGKPYYYRYKHPLYPHPLTVDCYAETVALATASARRWINRENTRLRQARIAQRLRQPREHHMRVAGE